MERFPLFITAQIEYRKVRCELPEREEPAWKKARECLPVSLDHRTMKFKSLLLNIAFTYCKQCALTELGLGVNQPDGCSLHPSSSWNSEEFLAWCSGSLQLRVCFF